MIFQVMSSVFEKHEDCLHATADEYAEIFELETWEVTASWEDDNRDIIRIELPDSCWDEGEEEDYEGEDLYEEDEEWEDEDLYDEDEE